SGAYKHIHDDDKNALIIDIISEEAIQTSEIEGEHLNRDSVQSSLKRHFGLTTEARRIPPAEQGISEMMIDVYETFADALTHDTIYRWHSMLTKGRRDLIDIGRYRTFSEPMQVVSGPLHRPLVHFEAPPSEQVRSEARRIPPAEQGISEMMIDVYETFADALTHDTIYRWHSMLTKGRRDLIDIGRYRTFSEPMQVVSGPLHRPLVHFEAPPSEQV